MKCPRCGRRNPEASWYCAHCGQSLPDVSMGAAGVYGHVARWGRLALVAAVVIVALGGMAWLVANAARGRAVAERAAAGTATADQAARALAAIPADTATRPPPTVRIVTPAPGASPRPTEVPAPLPAGVRARPDGPVWRIPRLTRQPVLDGRLDEWPTGPSPLLPIESVVFGREYWHDAADLSAQAWAGWDPELLFLAVKVKDDVFSQPSRGERLYLGDGLELQVDSDLTGDWGAAAYNADDYQVGLSPGDFGAAPAEAFIWRPLGTPNTGIRVASGRLPDGYAVEAAIPWARFGVDPEQTAALGFALNVSDNDVPEPAQLTLISSSPHRSWGDPRTFGTLVLER
jgi:hypothetical protein